MTPAPLNKAGSKPIPAWQLMSEDYPTCPDCGCAAQGRGYFGDPYCGLCERSIRAGNLGLAPVKVDALGVGA